MNTLKLAIASVAAGVLAATAGGAQAMPVSKIHAPAAQSHVNGLVQVRHGGPHGGHHFRGGGFRHHHFHGHHFRHHRFWGPRVYFYGGGGGCYWLKEKALDTGSRYWWRRYHACRNGW